MPETFPALKQQTLQLCRDCAEMAAQHKKHDLAKSMEQAYDLLKAGKLLIVVVGEFKRGKSTLLNAFLNTPELMPADIDITTSVVTQVVYGEREKITVITGEPGRGKSTEITRDQIRDYVTERGNPDNQRQVRLLIVELPLPELKDGLTFVDTPGIGGVLAEHTAITYAYLPNADVVLFVTDATKPFTTDDLEFLELRILPHTRHIVFVVTKIDRVTNYKDIVESNRKKLSTLLKQPGSSIQIVPVSSTLKLDYIKARKPDPLDLEESNFTTLEETMWRFLRERRVQILLQRALVSVGDVVTELRAPLQEEWAALQKQSEKEIAAQDKRLEEAHKALKRLTSSNPEWYATLSDGLTDIRRNLTLIFQDRFAEIRRRLDQYTSNPRLIDNPIAIAGNLEADIDGLMTELASMLNREANRLNRRLEAETGLDINPFHCSGVPWNAPTFNPGNLVAPERTFYEKTMEVGREVTSSAAGGAGAGAIAGGILGGILGFVVGGVAGAIVGAKGGAAIGAGIGGVAGKARGVREGLRKVSEPDMSFYVPLLRNFIEDSRIVSEHALGDSVVEMERSMRDELRTRLKRAMTTTEEAIASVQRARTMTEKQAEERLKPVEDQLKKVIAMQEKAAELSQKTASLADNLDDTDTGGEE